MSFLTCFWLFPQNEHFSRSPPSPMRATCRSSLVAEGGRESGQPAPARYPAPVHVLLIQRWCRRAAQPVPPKADADCASRARRARPGRIGSDRRRGLATDQHLVDQPVLLRLVGREDLVALDVGANLLDT